MVDTDARRRTPARLVVAVVLLAAAAVAAPVHAAPSTKYYSATPAAVVVPADGTGVATLTFTNCSPCGTRSSTQSFGSVEVRYPRGAGLAETGTVASSPSGAWSVTPRFEGGEVVLRLTNPGPGTTYAVVPGGAVSLAIAVPSGSAGGRVQLTTRVKQSNDFSGKGNDVALVGPDPVVYVGVGPPDHLELVQGASTVQVSPSSDPAAALTMCPAPVVEVLDADGHVVTWLPPTAVTLSTGATSADLRVNGDGRTSAGVVTFGADADAEGACLPTTGDNSVSAGTLGRGYRLTATLAGTTLSVKEVATFDVLPFYVRCPRTCSAGGSDLGTTAALSAVLPAGTTAPAVGAALTFGVGVDTWGASLTAACNPDVGGTVGSINEFRSPVTVDLVDHDKTVQLRWSKKAVQWATNNGSSQWGVCMAAAYGFPTAGGSPATLVGIWYVGALPRCSAAVAGWPCISSLTRQGGEQLATVLLPDREGDPRMI